MSEKSNGGKWKWILLAAVLAAGAGGYFYFHHGSGEKLSFNTVAVTRGELTATVTATGILNPVVNVTVGSQVSGRISKLYVDYNSPVTKGQVLAEIDPATYQAAVEQAGADLANAKANLELQQVQFDRSSELYTRVFGWQLAKADWRLKKESARQTPPKWLNYAGEKSE